METTTQQLLKLLQDAIKKQNHQKVYEYSSGLLKENKDDPDYIECFVISAIKTNAIKQLQTEIFKSAPTQPVLHKLYAYYLYTIGDYFNAIKYIQSIKVDNTLRLLSAQCYFKILNYQKSAQIMSQLLKQLKLEHDDRQSYTINLLATGHNNVLNQKSIKQYSQIIGSQSCKQLFYNYAMVLFQFNRYQESLKQLTIFQSLLQKDTDQIDIISAEIFRNYLAYKSGNLQITSNLIENYQQNIHSNDQSLNNVVMCNLIALKGHNSEQINQQIKLFQDSMNIQSKVSRQQLLILKNNKISLLLRKNKLTEASKLLKEIQSFTDIKILLSNELYIKNKYYLLKKNKQIEQINKLINLLKQNKNNLAYLLHIDYCKELGHQDNLIKDLKAQNFNQNVILNNYIFSLLIANPKYMERQKQYLEQLIKNNSNPKILETLLEIYSSTNNITLQKQIVNKILSSNPKNEAMRIKKAKLLILDGNIVEAENVLKGIDTPQDITDISYLHTIQKNMHFSINKQQQILQEVHKNQPKKKIKKKKRVKLPKGVKFLQGFKPDPQRWLPKWQRKGYKKKGKKGMGKTQGLATVGKDQTKNTFTSMGSTSGKEVTKEVQKKRR